MGEQTPWTPHHDGHHGGSECEHPVLLQLAEEFRQPDEQDGGEHHTDLAAETAENDDSENDGRLNEGEALRADEPLAGCEEGAAEAPEHGADGKCRELGVARVNP